MAKTTNKKIVKRKRKRNKFVSVGFIFIWVALIGTCIYINQARKEVNRNKAVIAIENTEGKNNKETLVSNKEVNNKSQKVVVEKEENNKQVSNNTKKEKENVVKTSDIEKKPKGNNNPDNNDAVVSKNNQKDQAKEEKQEKENKNNTSQKSTSSDKTGQSNNVSENEKVKQETLSEAKEQEKKEPVNKVAFNPDNRVVVIDPGHANKSNHEKEPTAPGSSKMKIKDGGGAVGTFTKVPEYVVAMDVSMKLKALLEEKGFTVIMTKTEHEVSLGNVDRAQIGNEANAALVIRVHADSFTKASAHGASMLVPAKNQYTEAIYDESKRCGEIVINSMVKEAGMYNRGLVYTDNITGFNWSKVPVILVEMGFLSNEEEDKLLSTLEYQNKIAKGLADGIEKALTP